LLMITSSARAEVNLNKICTIESNCRDDAFNKKEEARGRYQIRPAVLQEYNQAHRIKITSQELHHPTKAKIVAEWYFNKRIPQMIRHFGLVDSDINRIVAWNAGISNLKKGRVPELTKRYIRKYRGKA
jgi:hypothetical protein